ncbi:MAG: ATP-grasp ligase forming mycosporine-glycine, MysC, partial [uncultured Actinomycetospora sp.]
GRQAGDPGVGAPLRRRPARHRPGLVRLHRDPRWAPRRPRVQPADALGDHDVPPRRGGPGPGLPRGPRRAAPDAARGQPPDPLALPRAVADGVASVDDPRAPRGRAPRHRRRVRPRRPAAVPAPAPPADPVAAAAQPRRRPAVDPRRRQHRQARRAGGGL